VSIWNHRGMRSIGNSSSHLKASSGEGISPHSELHDETEPQDQYGRPHPVMEYTSGQKAMGFVLHFWLRFIHRVQLN
jgi:hypothetical protein